MHPTLTRLSFRHVLSVLFFLLAAIPAAAIGVLLSNNAWDRELQTVQEQHLQLACNLAGALARDAEDAEAMFQMVALNIAANRPVQGVAELLHRLHFTHVCLVDDAGQAERFVASDPTLTLGSFPVSLLETLRAAGDGEGGLVTFSDVVPDRHGEPTIFLWRSVGEGRYALGALKTDYFVRLQSAIAFGVQGRAAIGDRTGHVIAHPNTQWRALGKDISMVDPVQRMMAGETGVSRFFSPAVRAHMIAGFTTVPKVGWGVMIPQPIAELEAHVAQVQRTVVRYWPGAAVFGGPGCAGVSLVGGFRTLLEDPDRVDRRAVAEAGLRNTARLLLLINELLDLARLESGRALPAKQCIDLAALVRHVAANFESSEAKRRIRLQGVNEVVAAVVDPRQIKKVLYNLLSNAFKYTDPESGQVWISLQARPNQVELRVQDNGVGIPSDQLDRIFERFIQVEAGTARLVEGTGIGLALVKEILTQHGGSIAVDSRVGGGTTFSMTLPRGDVEAGMPAGFLGEEPEMLDFLQRAARTPVAQGADAQAVPEAAEQAPLVLAVEDNSDLLTYLPRELDQRISVNTGYCTVGIFGSDLLQSYTVVGTPVNIASRLQAEASAGGIICGFSTYSLVHDRVPATPRGQLSLRGVAHPVEAYEIHTILRL
ncbi:MAG: hypothetical protein HYZ81_12250 [Nitrospinae bacterium]|nr:hypothetical protein [Nitrospinota bacterium]